jgi:hypothetical protein
MEVRHFGGFPALIRGVQGRRKLSVWAGVERHKVAVTIPAEATTMSQYLFLYRNDAKAEREWMQSPEAIQKSMEQWGAWMKSLGEKGHMKDIGNPLEPNGKVVKGKDKTVTDGPFAEAKDIVGGYTIVEAKDLAHAAELSKGCPIFDAGGWVEVRPIMKMDM